MSKTDVEGADVFFNGRFIGNAKEPSDFSKKIREKRRDGSFPIQMSVRNDPGFQTVLISTESGRVLRPLVIADNGISKLKNEHKVQIENGEMKWGDLLSRGIIEYLDAAEEENALTALYEEELTPEHTHLEVDNVGLLGVVTSLVPYGNHDQSSRLNRGSKTQKTGSWIIFCKLSLQA